ncbi:MAG: threonine ammonia-lyase [Thermoproteota archaeon]|jgi:threonine dehydratase, medium form
MITYEDILRARKILKDVVHKTPLDYSTTFSKLTGCNVYLKLECLQKTGAFKVRGAYNKIFSLSDEQKLRGVVTASAGNHAQGVAYSSKILGIKCTVVMPVNASPAKVAATRSYGAEIVFHGNMYDNALEKALEIAEKENKVFIHAFDDEHVIAGQGTIGIEILEDLPDVDAVIMPVGGGGLASGIAIAIKSKKPNVKIIGVQTKAFPAIKETLEKNRIVEISNGFTIADGIAVKKPGNITLEILRKYMDDIGLVDDEQIVKTMFLLMERSKLVIEPAGAVGLAYLLNEGNEKLKDKKVVVVLSGGNVDMFLLGQIVHKGLGSIGRLVRISVQLYDRPGELKKVIDTIAANRVNIVDVMHDRLGSDVRAGSAKVILSLEAESSEHIDNLLKILKDKGIEYQLEP